jgi:hypothetical protein
MNIPSESRTRAAAGAVFAVVALSLVGWTPRPAPVTIPLDSTAGLRTINVSARATTYHDRKAVELTAVHDMRNDTTLHTLALIDTPEFQNGTIDLWVAGTLTADAAPDDRAFIGIVFRSADDASHFENVYLRPTNGRADDQLRRNHATQYESFPGYPWYRLRKETPGQYESYVDLLPDEWTHMRVVVHARRAELYVNDSTQPCLVVSDLKLGDIGGKVGLWIGPGTRGYFTKLVIDNS